MSRENNDGWISQGVKLIDSESVYIDPAVPAGHIAEGVTIYPGCRIMGEKTAIGPGCVIGREAPATVLNCQLASKVDLAGGYFEESVFLSKASAGSGAHIRPGCLLEEEAGVAHSVGLKQTVFLPCVTAGSLINFCDALMAGGRNRKEHSEIGSSYIHFNFTPHGDKATPSLIGDVPRGVLMDNDPVFLGGQGGLAGPCRVAFGTVIPAGSVLRSDVLQPGMLHLPAASSPKTECYDMRVYKRIRRVAQNNLHYIGNIYALREWYRNVRSRMMTETVADRACCTGAIRVLNLILDERMKRLKQWTEKLGVSYELIQENAALRECAEEQVEWIRQWPERETLLKTLLGQEADATGIAEIATSAANHAKDGFLTWVKGLDDAQKTIIRAWLDELVLRFYVR
ncbi:MAG: UDP-N-acetylglucosamine pyrophosphorylase [Kiritimatiellae bacterium]|nr:UDP-N-acetylglucosamine pyrophosphorylase [Kiritimatiellia bacterium]